MKNSDGDNVEGGKRRLFYFRDMYIIQQYFNDLVVIQIRGFRKNDFLQYVVNLDFDYWVQLVDEVYFILELSVQFVN